MRTIRTVGELRAALAPARREGRSIGLVPTMGAFHDGHLSLMRHARADCDVVVVSLFVNPTQFGAGEDLGAYPRDEQRDAGLASEEGADLLFAPPIEQVYPDGFATTVSVTGITEVLDGDPERRGREHFDGVATVVTKLFNMAQPDVAYFGQKDAQQALVIQRLVRDLDIPVRVEVCPTVREEDGLAMSSRNVYLSPDERECAPQPSTAPSPPPTPPSRAASAMPRRSSPLPARSSRPRRWSPSIWSSDPPKPFTPSSESTARHCLQWPPVWAAPA